MHITRIAQTKVTFAPDSLINTSMGSDFYRWSLDESDSGHADIVAEFAGRSCYQSWERPNPKTARTEDYLANILAQAHESVLEHASVTYYIEGVSRSLTHELIRHRHLSFSELSQRYVDMEEAEMVIPPAAREFWEGGDEAIDLTADDWWAENPTFTIAREVYKTVAQGLADSGYTRKQAREAARAVMPNCVETKIVVTGNMRAWRDVLKKRWSVHADAEIRQLAGLILEDLREVAPGCFQDIPEAPYQ